MTTDHGRVSVPFLEVCHWLIVDSTECESCDFRTDLHLVGNLEKLILDCLLAFNNTDNKGVDDVQGCLGMSVWPFLCVIDKSVPAKEKFRDITSIVVDNIEFATRMDALETIDVQDEIVKYDERLSIFHLLVNFCGCKCPHLIFFSLLNLRSINVAHGVLVAHTENSFADND